MKIKKGDRLIAVYNRNGNIVSVHIEPYDAFEKAVNLNKNNTNDKYFIDWIIIQ